MHGFSIENHNEYISVVAQIYNSIPFGLFITVPDLNRCLISLCYNTRVESGRGTRILFGVIFMVVALTTIPYLYAQITAGQDFGFTGFLLNPIDGNSYLAKMYQGRQGNWRFTLPFTAEQGEGAFLFLFYIFLGHISRWTGIALIPLFHLARVIATIVMLVSLFRFFRTTIARETVRNYAFVLAAFGSGLGWLTVPFGGFTSDFWVAEAYPFLSAYANPHFPLGLALLLWLITPGERNGWQGLGYALGGLALALVLPFGVLVAGFILVALSAWTLRKDPWPVQRLFWLLLGGAGILLYDFWVVKSNPVFGGWNAQNQTPSPPFQDLLISFSPAFWLALIGAWSVIRRGESGSNVMPVWTIVVLALIYLPFNLQRRLLMGFFIPLSGLAALGMQQLIGERPSLARLVFVGVFVLSIPTNVLVLLAARHGAQTHDPLLYLQRSEIMAFNWVKEETPADALFLTAPDTGLFLPANTGRRVLYGHPFETLDAETERALVSGFFQNPGSAESIQALADQRGLQYLFWGPRERALGGGLSGEGLSIVYQSEDVRIYALQAP